jgi:hypothetical protein
MGVLRCNARVGAGYSGYDGTLIGVVAAHDPNQLFCRVLNCKFSDRQLFAVL